MLSIAWWPNVIVLVLAAGIDMYSHRIPNWLVVPFLVGGLLVQSITGGLAGAGRSLAGMGVACLVLGVPCFLRAMGMGDLKLAAGVGAWVGWHQLLLALIYTGIAGGVLAVIYALGRGSLAACLDRTGDLLHLQNRGHARLGSPAAVAMPYAPAIAIGTLFSFFAG
jgi:prepilin peptidase CpaA